jgi:hypothetical protein
MFARKFAWLAVVALAPALAHADRGAFTLEAAPAATILPSAPSQGTGASTTGSAAGAMVSARYALRNDIELAAAAFYELPASYYHGGVELDSLVGTMAERTDRYGAVAGVRWVRGLVWRVHVGAEVGWSHQRYWARDLIDVSDPANVHSYGLGLEDESADALVLAPVLGIEWQVTDRWTVSAMPRVQFMLGGVNRVMFVVPLSVGYSWFVF